MLFSSENIRKKHRLISVELLASDHTGNLFPSSHPRGCVPWGLIEIRQRFSVCSISKEAWRSDWLLNSRREGSPAGLVGICTPVYVFKKKCPRGSPSEPREGLLWSLGKNSFVVEKIIPVLMALGHSQFSSASHLGRQGLPEVANIGDQGFKMVLHIVPPLGVRWFEREAEVISSLSASATLWILAKIKMWLLLTGMSYKLASLCDLMKVPSRLWASVHRV